MKPETKATLWVIGIVLYIASLILGALLLPDLSGIIIIFTALATPLSLALIGLWYAFRDHYKRNQ